MSDDKLEISVRNLIDHTAVLKSIVDDMNERNTQTLWENNGID